MNLLWLSDRSPASVNQYLLPHERRVVTLREHPAKLLGPLTVSVAGLASLITAGAIHGGTVLVATSAACLVLLLYALTRVTAWYGAYFVVTDARMIIIAGLLARELAMVPLSQITDMSFQRSMLGRLLGYGTFFIELAGEGQMLRKLSYMPYPEQIFLEIADLVFPADPEEYAQEPDPEEFK
jgi:Bacterial PH domain